MKMNSFWRGMGAGVIAGVTLGVITAVKKDSMHTGVGRAMQQASTAMDNALYDFWHTMQ